MLSVYSWHLSRRSESNWGLTGTVYWGLCKKIIESAKTTKAKNMGPVPLPTKRRVYCVLNSLHVHKDSRFHFQIRMHQRLIDIMYPTCQSSFTTYHVSSLFTSSRLSTCRSTKSSGIPNVEVWRRWNCYWTAAPRAPGCEAATSSRGW
jgi:ribosomal protein S10